MITCCNIRKTFIFDVEDQLRKKWAFYKGKWRQLKPNYQDEKWFEDYKYGIAETKDMLECWLSYLPGIVEWGDYHDFSVTFDMKDVEEVGWSEQHLLNILGDMATYIRMRQVIHAEEPWLTSSFDIHGDERPYYRHPAIDPLDGMLDREYPHVLVPTG